MRSYENALSSRLGRSERSKAIPETISLINQENIWPGLRWSRKKKWNKNVPTEYRHYLSKKSPFHQVFEVTSLCLRGTLQRREKKRMVRHEVRSTIKIHHYIRLVCESRAKIPSSDIADDQAPLVFWGDRDDCMEITNRPSLPDRLEIFWIGDDHMETRA